MCWEELKATMANTNEALEDVTVSVKTTQNALPTHVPC